MNRTQLLIRTAYDGSRFYGVTPQPKLATVGAAVQARVEAAFETRCKALVFAARTDAGVHAVENLATCWLRDAPNVRLGLARLGGRRHDGLDDLVAQVVPKHVFARTIATSKRYRYRLEGDHDPAFIQRLRLRDLARRKDPSLPRLPPAEGRVWQVALPLDIDAMRLAANHLVGTHDWTGFKVAPLGDRSPMRTVRAITLHQLERDGRPHIVIDIHGDGFLRKMVRIIVGTLAEVGAGLRAPDDMPQLLAARDRQVTGQAALARGLTLLQLLPPSFATTWSEPPGLPALLVE